MKARKMAPAFAGGTLNSKLPLHSHSNDGSRERMFFTADCKVELYRNSNSIHSKRPFRCCKSARLCKQRSYKCVQAQDVRASLTFDFGIEDGRNPFFTPPPPQPVKFPRRPLDMKLAVVFMRSAYETVDALNFIPMDKFQVKFWKLRQSEVEAYTLQYSPLRISYGNLADPLYFDFISFAQSATISQAMREGEQVFQERLGVDGEVRTVVRDPSLRDNKQLPAAFRDGTADRIYSRLREGFEEENFDAPAPVSPSAKFSEILRGVQQLLGVLQSRGYCLTVEVVGVDEMEDGRGGQLKVRVEGPATLWGMQGLASRRAMTSTDFDAMALEGFLRASGRKWTLKSRLTDTGSEALWTIR